MANTKYPDPIITTTAIIFDLHEPIYGSVFAIYEKWLKIARYKSLIMIVKTPFGTATYRNPADWLKGAKKIKKYHNYSDPMIMFSRSVLPDIKDRIKRKKIEKKIELSGNALLNAMSRLKRKEPELFSEVRRKLGLR